MTRIIRKLIPFNIFCLLLSVFCYFVVAPVSSAFAGETAAISINSSTFPDGAFRQWVLENVDTNKNQLLDLTEIAETKTINISKDKAISSVTGIEYFTALEQMNCSYTNLHELDLSQNTMLKNLDAISTHLIALSMPESFSGISSITTDQNVIWLNEGETAFNLNTWAPSIDPQCIQGISLPSVTLNGTTLKGLVPGEDFSYYYVYDGTSNFNYTPNKIHCSFAVRSTSTKPVSVRPDTVRVFTDTPLPIFTGEVTAKSLYALAQRSYYNSAGEFVIDATSSIPVDAVDIDFAVISLPTGDYGKLNDLGIETNFGHLRIKAEALRTLFNVSTYSSVHVQIQKSGENKYFLRCNVRAVDGSPSPELTFPDDSIQFTTVPDGTLAGKTLQYRFSRVNEASVTRDCIHNANGSVTMHAEKYGTYTLLEKRTSASENEVKYTLNIVNQSYGYVDQESENILTIGTNRGYYVQDILVNGVSVGPKESLSVSEGDNIRVVFAKIGETVDIYTGKPPLSKTERIIAGIQTTTIKAKTVNARKGIKISWTKSKGYAVDHFELFRSTKKTTGYGKTAFFTTKTGKATAYTNTKLLKKGTRYYYKIRGVRTLNGKKYYTQWSNICYRKAL